MSWLKNLFNKDPFGAETRAVYERIVAQARLLAFYRDLGVPDTLEGRFDMLCLHAFLVMHRLKAELEQTRNFSQALFDLMFQDVEQNLRIAGVSDIRIGKKVKARAEAFGGRVQAYDQALQQQDSCALAASIARNVYRELPDGPPPGAPTVLAKYMQDQAAHLADQSVADIMAGRVEFLAFDEKAEENP